jgi:hypothetical protein
MVAKQDGIEQASKQALATSQPSCASQRLLLCISGWLLHDEKKNKKITSQLGTIEILVIIVSERANCA